MIDLHTHTTCSDGKDSPRTLINKAIIAGVQVLALTDHDTTSGWSIASESLRGTIELVLGAEISCLTTDGISIHVLGLLFDGENAVMQQMLEQTSDARLPRMRKIIELMRADGFDISMDDVDAAKPYGATLGRPHLADALVAKKIVKSREEAFIQLLNNGSKYYVSHAAPTPAEAISVIKSAGGVSIIAHPFASLRGRILESTDFQELVSAGLNAIEVDHRDHNPQEREALRKIAEELKLVVTGSSDYHGSGKPNLLGENRTHPAQWELLESQADKRRVLRG